MSEIILEPEDQSTVVVRAAKILRERVIGGIDEICVSPIDRDFLAFEEKDVGKKFPELLDTDSPEEKEEKLKKYPEELDILSVERVVLSCIDELLRWNNNPPEENISQEIVQNICNQVISILKTRKPGKATKLPRRLAEAVEHNLTRIEEEISQMETEVDQKMELLKEEGLTGEEKGHLYTEIHHLLIKIREYNQKIIDINKLYDFSVLYKDKDVSEEEDDDEKDGGRMSDSGGGIGLLDRNDEPENTGGDSLTLEEDISLSRSETRLLRYVPKDIQMSDEFSQKKYFWHEQGEEWQRSKFHIKDYPQPYSEMLQLLIQRKKIVAFYAEKSIYERRGRLAENKDIQDLRKEIHKLEETMSKIKVFNEEDYEIGDEEVRSGENVPEDLSPEEQVKGQIEGNLEFMYENLELNLLMYVKKLGIRTHAVNEVKKYVQEIKNTIKQLETHCKKYHLESQYIAQLENDDEEENVESEQPEESENTCISVEEYIDDPFFFRSFPEVINISMSKAEAEVQKLYSITIEEFLLPAMAWGKEIGLVYEEEDGTEASIVQKMEAIEGVLQIVIRRKMLFYFYARQKMIDESNPEVSPHLEVLEREITTIQTSLNMVTRRIVWEKQEDADKGRDLHVEIEDLGQKRFRLLQAFVAAQNHRERALIGQKIFTYCHALEERRGELNDIPDRPEPDEYIDAPDLNSHEADCLQYVLPDIQMAEEQLFSDKIGYTGKKLNSKIETKKEKQKLVWSFVTERKMLIYFFMMKRMLDIDMSLVDTSASESELFLQEREKLEGYVDIFHREIAEGLRHISGIQEAKTESRKPKKLHYQTLYNQAMSVFSGLDGFIAHTNGEHETMIKEYWERIQKLVLRFSDRIKIEETKGNLDLIPALQAEFDSEMVSIIGKIETYLEQILLAQGHKGVEPEIMKGEIEKIREKLFQAPHAS